MKAFMVLYKPAVITSLRLLLVPLALPLVDWGALFSPEPSFPTYFGDVLTGKYSSGFDKSAA